MGLQDLPPETLFQICELFCEHCQGKWFEQGPPPEWWGFDQPHKSLLALSLVCKSIGPIAQRVLHHHFGHGRNQDESVAQFYHTISNNPELAKGLRWAKISSWRIDEAPEDLVQGWLPKTINKFDYPLFGGGKGISYKALSTAAILLQAPNLERLDDAGRGNLTAFHLLSHNALNVPPPNLKHLCLGTPVNSRHVYDMTMVDLSRDGLGSFINSLKELVSLTIHCPLASGVDERLSFQSLRVLRLHQIEMPRTDLENLLLRMPRLETFAFSRPHYDNLHVPGAATGSEILEALAQRNDTLRRLELDMTCAHDDIKPLEALTNLEQLKLILGEPNHTAVHRNRSISKQAFASMMPPSLQKLHIHVQWKETFEKASGNLMAYISSTYRESPHDQRLQMVHLDLTWQGSDWSTRQRDIFQQGCQEWAKNGTLIVDTEWYNWHLCQEKAVGLWAWRE